eukprot:2610632-Ditylum_brightwellii.AAC.1
MSSSNGGRIIPPNDDNDAQNEDGRGGIKFGTSIAYDDAYAMSGDEHVTSLPTEEEEKKIFGDDDDRRGGVRAREEMEMEDVGRA